MPSSRSVRKIRIAISPRFATRTLEKGAISRVFSPAVTFADQLTVARAAAVPLVVVLYVWSFSGHDYWATSIFAFAMATDWFDGRLARRSGRTSALGSLLDPVADKLLVLTVLVVLVGRGVFAGWMVAAIVARELLISGLRLSTLERGVVLQARDLGTTPGWRRGCSAAHPRGWPGPARRGRIRRSQAARPAATHCHKTPGPRGCRAQAPRAVLRALRGSARG